jgi:PAP2 superfamily
MRSTSSLLSIALLTGSLFLQACGGGGGSTPAASPPPAPPPPDTTAVATWNEAAMQTVANAQTSGAGLFSNNESRIYAIVFGAVHDTLNAIDRRYQPYLTDTRAAGANPDAAVAAAARDTLVALVPNQSAFVQTKYAQALSAIADSTAKTAGIALGQQVAAAALAARATDGAAQAEAPYIAPSQSPGVYQKTPDGSGALLEPVGVKWGEVKPFVLTSQSQFRNSFDASRSTAPGPYALGSKEYAVDVAKAIEIGSRQSAARVPFATETAKFWLENSPPQWNRAAVSMAAAKKLNGWQQARLYAALHLAMADALIACYEAKYFHKFWRPYTAIRAADTDGNDATTVDPAWVQVTDSTPPTPEYPSAHGAAGGAASAVLVGVFEAGAGAPPGAEDPDEDNNPFTLTSTSLAGVTHSYRGFRHAARENAISRIYVGFHFSKSVYDGKKMGRDVGEYLLANRLKPLQ